MKKLPTCSPNHLQHQRSIVIDVPYACVVKLGRLYYYQMRRQIDTCEQNAEVTAKHIKLVARLPSCNAQCLVGLT